MWSTAEKLKIISMSFPLGGGAAQSSAPRVRAGRSEWSIVHGCIFLSVSVGDILSAVKERDRPPSLFLNAGPPVMAGAARGRARPVLGEGVYGKEWTVWRWNSWATNYMSPSAPCMPGVAWRCTSLGAPGPARPSPSRLPSRHLGPPGPLPPALPIPQDEGRGNLQEHRHQRRPGPDLRHSRLQRLWPLCRPHRRNLQGGARRQL